MSESIVSAPAAEQITVTLAVNSRPYVWALNEVAAKTRKSNGKTATIPGYSYLWPTVPNLSAAGVFLTDLLAEAEKSKAGNGLALFNKLVGKRILDANKASIDDENNLDETKLVPDLTNPGHRAGINIDELMKQREVLIEEWMTLQPLGDLPPNAQSTIDAISAAGYRTRDELIRAAVANRSKISEMTKLIAAHNNKLAESAAKRNATKAAKAAAPIVAAPVK